MNCVLLKFLTKLLLLAAFLNIKKSVVFLGRRRKLRDGGTPGNVFVFTHSGDCWMGRRVVLVRWGNYGHDDGTLGYDSCERKCLRLHL